MDKKGAALILISILLVALTIFSTALISSSFSENAFAIRYLESTQAFWLAEAGINRALSELKINPVLYAIDNTELGQIGGYNATIDTSSLINLNGDITVTAHGFIPLDEPFRADRVIQVIINRTTSTPTNFYNDTVLYSTNDINITNNAFDINGNVIYGDEFNVKNPDNINGTNTSVPNATLPELNFAQLKYLSQRQGYYYNGTDIEPPPFPTEFWNNQTAQIPIPNVYFWDTPLLLTLKGSVGGLFIVGGGGNVTNDIRIIGNVNVQGCIYATGQFRIDGGGGQLNIDGAVFAGNALINGGGTLAYNDTYMQIMQAWSSNVDSLTVTSWEDMDNTYNLD